MPVKMLIIPFMVVFCVSLTLSADASAPKFVGSQACSCHKAHISDWKLSIHGRAFETLKPGVKKRAKIKAHLDPDKDYTKEEKCLKCHTTGYRKKGGFINIDKTPDRVNVGCESCHGPGSEYLTLHEERPGFFDRVKAKAWGQTYGSENSAVCTACHNKNRRGLEKDKEQVYEFHWEKSLEKRKAYHRKLFFKNRSIFQ